MIRHIVAVDERNGFSKAGGIPWDLPTDKSYYRDFVRGQLVLMGAATYGPSGARHTGYNYVLSHDALLRVINGERVATIEEALQKVVGKDLWVIGGTAVYEPTIQLADELYITRVTGDFHCDRWYPPLPQSFKKTQQSKTFTENGIQFHFEIYTRI